MHPAQMTEVDWGHIFEIDQPQAAQTRRQVFKQAEAQDTTIFACHFPPPGVGRLVRIEGRRYWQGGI